MPRESAQQLPMSADCMHAVLIQNGLVTMQRFCVSANIIAKVRAQLCNACLHFIFEKQQLISKGLASLKTTLRVFMTPEVMPKGMLTKVNTRVSDMVQAASALGLPGPRQSVGVELEGNAYAVLLPNSVCAPCSATQVFTTVHDGQTQASFFALLSTSHICCDSTVHTMCAHVHSLAFSSWLELSKYIRACVHEL